MENYYSFTGHRLLALGEQMEQAFILDSPDLSTADAAATEASWRLVVISGGFHL